MSNFYDQFFERGSKGQWPLSPSPTHACEDQDLELLDDNEVSSDGSEPTVPLPNFFGHISGQWPFPLQDIVNKGKTPHESDILLVGALVVLGSTLGPKVRTMYNGKWLSPSMMFFAVAPPGSGKGVLSWLRAFVQPLHDKLVSKYEKEKEVYDEKKLKFDCMGKERVNCPKEDIPVMPVRKFFIIPGNNSGTGMQANIINSDGRGIIFEPEADTLSSALNADYGHFDDALRKAFDHESLTFYRRTGDESREVRSSYLSILLSGTPGQVKRLIPTGENGLFSRFMFYYMPPVRKWKSQFEEKEDLGEWYKSLADRWLKTLESHKHVSYFSFSLSEAQVFTFNARMENNFDVSINALGDEASSVVLRMAHHLLRIMSVVALLRSFEKPEMLQPDPSINADNVKDGIVGRYVYGISDEDFMSCLSMGKVLFSHAAHILSLLPASTISSRESAAKVELFGSFKNSFTRKELLVKAKELGIKSGTVLTWLKRGKDRQFKSDGRGTYIFVHACVGEGDRGH